MKRVFLLAIIYVLACIGGYIYLEKDKIIAKQYLQKSGYEVVSYEGKDQLLGGLQ